MQRYSIGRKVPQLMLDIFTGKTTGVGGNVGEVTCGLTYTPRSAHYIIVPAVKITDYLAHPEVISLTGKTLLLKFYVSRYDKSHSTVSDSAALTNPGAGDPHTHTVTFDTVQSSIYALSDTSLGTIRVSYGIG